MGVTPTPNQAVHTLTVTATESGWCLVGGVGNQRTGGQQTQQRAQGKQGGPHTHTASWSSDRGAWEPKPRTHLYLLSSVG